jgi:hypothetical protein
MRKRGLLALLSVVLTASQCPNGPPAATPTLVNVGGFGRWIKATATRPDTFGFAVRAAEDVCPDVQHVSFQTCPARYPDTAFIDFSIPTRTSFEVSGNGQVLTEVAQAATMGDLQYRKAQLSDGSGAYPLADSRRGSERRADVVSFRPLPGGHRRREHRAALPQRTTERDARLGSVPERGDGPLVLDRHRRHAIGGLAPGAVP